MESDLHLSMKKAVVRDIGKGSKYWTEYLIGYCGSGSLRVDVNFSKNRRKYLVECETRPKIKRLIQKGKRRNKIRYRTVYILVVTSEWYRKLDWTQLKGYFDIIMSYDVEEDTFTERWDLRFLGPQRDTVLDIIVPIYMSEAVQSIYLRLVMGKNQVKHTIRKLIQCSACRIGIETHWKFCPKFNCPNSVSYF